MTAASPKTDELVEIMVKAAREAVTGYPHTQTLTFQMRAALAALEAAGMVIVPREPEADLLAAMSRSWETEKRHDMAHAYRALVAAATR